MIDINVIIDDRMQAVQDAMEKAAGVKLRDISSRVVNRARRSIRPHRITISRRNTISGGGYLTYKSSPGSPPSSKFIPGKNIRDAITSNRPQTVHELLAAKHSGNIPDTGAVQIGTNKSEIGDIGEVMELGGEYKGKHYEPHPYLFPALRDEIDSFAGSFQGSLGGGGLFNAAEYSEFKSGFGDE